MSLPVFIVGDRYGNGKSTNNTYDSIAIVIEEGFTMAIFIRRRLVWKKN